MDLVKRFSSASDAYHTSPVVKEFEQSALALTEALIVLFEGSPYIMEAVRNYNHVQYFIRLRICPDILLGEIKPTMNSLRVEGRVYEDVKGAIEYLQKAGFIVDDQYAQVSKALRKSMEMTKELIAQREHH